MEVTYRSALYNTHSQLYERMVRREITYVVCPNSIDLLDLVRERHRLVDEQLQEIVWRGLASQQLELLVDCPAPSENDTCTNLSHYVSDSKQSKRR